MTRIHTERMTAEPDDQFVVFLIGMRINRPLKVWRWWPVVQAMPRMLGELYRDPESGLISHESWPGRTTIMVQYWRSFAHLDAYARSRESEHLPAWAEFNRRVGNSGDVGIWHETYLIGKGQHESVYGNMPRFGLARAGRHVPATGRLQSAQGRLAERG